MEFVKVKEKDLSTLENKVDQILDLMTRNKIVRTPLTLENEIENDWLDSFQVIKVLHISMKTLQRLRNEGFISYSKIRDKYYYHVSDIEEALRKRVIRCSPETIEDFYQNYLINAK